MLPLRTFGKTGFLLSPLGLGTVKIGRNQKTKYAPFELPENPVLMELLETARGCGINLIDTAPAYGVAEERLGALLGPLREEFRIFTKAGESFAEGQSHYDFSREGINASIDGSLRRLRTDRLDCVLLHCSRRDVDEILNTPALQVLEERKKCGDVLSVGISTMSLEGGKLAVERADVLMVAYNPGYTVELPVIQAAAERDRGILIKKGLFSGNIVPKSDTDPVVECVRAALALPGNPTLVVGTINPAHLRRNAEIVSQVL